jgi:ComF family protein
MKASDLGRLLLHIAGELLSPHGCAACDERAATVATVARVGSVFCAACAASVVRACEPAPGEARVLAFAEFGGAIAEAVRKLKYAARTDLARPLGDLLRGAARDAGVSAHVVVPVPLHPKRLAERGYNQAALLAVHVARELGVPMAACALMRTRDTPRQASLDRGERRNNVRSAFRAARRSAVEGRRVLLVDDVATTGATLTACADALTDAGARSVRAVVLARTPRRSLA